MITLADGLSLVFQSIAYASACAAFLALLVLCCELLLSKRLPASLRYTCWLVVFARLAFPALPASPFSLYNLAASDSAPVAVFGPQTLHEAQIPNAVPWVAPPIPASPPAPDHAVGWMGILAWVWSSVSLLLLTQMCIETLRFSRKLGRNHSPAPQAARDLLLELAAELRIRRMPEILETALVSVPSLAGILRPKLLLPAGFVSATTQDMLRHVLHHELAHLRRGDLLIHQLARLLVALHWFNPFAWFALRRLRFAQELSCDASVLRRLQPEEIPMYGRTLLALQERISGRHRCAATLAMLSARPQTTSRIHAIARYTKPSTTERLATLLALFVFGAVALTDAQEKQPQAVIVPLVESGSVEPAVVPSRQDASPKGLNEVLQQRVSLQFKDRHLAEIVGEFALNYEINVVMDQRAIKLPGVKGSPDDTRREAYVKSVDLQDVTLAEALTSILKPLGLDYKVQPGFIWISLPEILRHESFEELETRYYEAPGIVDGKLKDVNGGDTDLDLVTFIQSRVPAIKEPRTGEALSAMHWENDSKMLIVRDIPENFIQIEALIEALGIPVEEQPTVRAASPADAPNSPPAALPEAGPLSVLDIVNLPPLRSQQLKQLGLESVKINMLRDPTPTRPLGHAVINLDKVQIGDLIPGTKAKLIGIDETRSLIGIEMTDTGERYRF